MSSKQHKCVLKKEKFICKKCGKMFYHRITLDIHKRSHRKDKPYKCGSCTKKFVLKSTMYQHVMSHVSTFTCQTCYKMFKTPWQLEQHVLNHMENMDVHKCLYCGRIFTKPDNFEKHLQFHVMLEVKGKASMKKKICQNKKDFFDDLSNPIPSQNYMDQSTTSFFIQDSRVQNNRNTEDSDSAESLIDESVGQVLDSDSAESFIDESVGQVLEDSPSVYYTENDNDKFTTCFAISSNDDMSDVEVGSSKDRPSITKFDCVLCKMSFEDVPTFIQHVNSHEPSEEDNLNQLIQTEFKPIGKGNTIYVCRCCDKKFASRSFVRDHLMHFVKNKTHNKHQEFTEEMKGVDKQNALNKYIYSICIKNLKSHESVFAHKKKLIYHCSICSTNFKETRSLFAHIKNCRKEKVKYCCPECCINFETNTLLKEHIQMGHQKIFTEPMPDLAVVTVEQSCEEKVSNTKLSCSKCVKSFDSLKEYEEHKIRHSAKAPIIEEAELFCAHCDASFSSAALLYRHILTHGNSRKTPTKNAEYADKMFCDEVSKLWVCKVCNKSYSTKCNLTRHLGLHDESAKEEIICPFCNRVFQYQRYLKHHILYMHKSEKEKIIKCPECDAVLRSVHSFTRHMTLHTGESELKRKLLCQYCGKRFKSQEELNMHVRTHTGEKPYACDRCSYRAAVYCNLKKHIFRRHENPKKVDGRKIKKIKEVK